MADQREKSMRQARKRQALGRLAGRIAHEVNTPAQYIRDNTRFVEEAFGKLQALLAACLELREAAQHETVTNHVVQKLVVAAEQANVPFLMREIPAAIGQSLEGIDLLTRILRSMTEFAQPRRQRPEAVDLNQLVETAAAMCRSRWKHVAELVTDFDLHLPPVTCFPDDLYQVLINLTTNAAHAIEEKNGRTATGRGRITVRTGHGDGWVKICVEDSGTGIAEDTRRRVFDRFFTTKKAGRGSGQGLAIVRSIVAGKYGGTVSFTTEVGQGTTFIVRIPLRPRVACGEDHRNEETDPVC